MSRALVEGLLASTNTEPTTQAVTAPPGIPASSVAAPASSVAEKVSTTHVDGPSSFYDRCAKHGLSNCMACVVETVPVVAPPTSVAVVAEASQHVAVSAEPISPIVLAAGRISENTHRAAQLRSEISEATRQLGLAEQALAAARAEMTPILDKE